MMPFVMVAAASLLSLVVFHLVLLVMWGHGSLDRRFFDVVNIATVAQIAGILTQVFSILVLTLLCWTVQKLAFDQSIRQGKSAQCHQRAGADK